VWPHAFWQGRLHQDAVASIVTIQPINQTYEFLEGRLGRQPMDRGVQPAVAGRTQLAGDIQVRTGIVADKDERQTWSTAGAPREAGHWRAQIVANLLSDGHAIKTVSRHRGRRRERPTELAGRSRANDR